MAEVKEAKRATVWDTLTLTGITLAEAYKRIDRDLGKAAYSPVNIGGQSFTDIKPPYVYEVLSECFGPCGLGWGFEVIGAEYLGSRTYKAQSGRDVTEHGARSDVICWFALHAPDGESLTRFKWGPVPGGAKNSERAYAESGSVTNAIGKAFSFFGVQRHIYKNGEPDAGYVTDEPADDEAAKPAPKAEAKSAEKPHDPDVAAYETLMAIANLKETKAAVGDFLGNPKTKPAGLKAYKALSEEKRVEVERIAEGVS